MAKALTGKQRRTLRALGHHLKPVVQVGQDDLTEGVIGAVDAQLAVHELIKIKVGESASTPRHEAAEQLAEKTDSELVQVLGRTVLLYRRHPEKPKIEL
jgi:RNA-binding protein